MQIQPILGLYQPIPPPPSLTLGRLFLQILDPALHLYYVYNGVRCAVLLMYGLLIFAILDEWVAIKYMLSKYTYWEVMI